MARERKQIKFDKCSSSTFRRSVTTPTATMLLLSLLRPFHSPPPSPLPVFLTRQPWVSSFPPPPQALNLTEAASSSSNLFLPKTGNADFSPLKTRRRRRREGGGQNVALRSSPPLAIAALNNSHRKKTDWTIFSPVFYSLIKRDFFPF